MKKIQSILNRFILNEHMHNTVRLQFDYMHAYIFIHNSKIAKYIESNVSVYLKKNISNISKMDEQIYEKPPEWSYACYSIYLFS